MRGENAWLITALKRLLWDDLNRNWKFPALDYFCLNFQLRHTCFLLREEVVNISLDYLISFTGLTQGYHLLVVDNKIIKYRLVILVNFARFVTCVSNRYVWGNVFISYLSEYRQMSCWFDYPYPKKKSLALWGQSM